MSDEDFPLLLRAPFETFLIRIVPAGSGSAATNPVSRRALLELRFGLENRNAEILVAAERLSRALSDPLELRFSTLDASSRSDRSVTELIRSLEADLARGRLLVQTVAVAPLDVEPELELSEPPGAPPPPVVDGPETFFEVQLVDEIGQGIPGIPIEFELAGSGSEVTSNAAGIALLEGIIGSAAVVGITETEALENVLDPRWKTRRPGKPPKVSNLTELVFQGQTIDAISVKAAVRQTVVLKPPLGKLFLELFDKTGRTRHVKRKFQIDGPESFDGETDEQGRVLQEDVFPGDYTLTLEVDPLAKDADDSDPARVEEFETPAVVLAGSESEPQVRFLAALPRLVMARIKNFVFETNKSFLLPEGVKSLQKIRDVYAEMEPAELLIVGHADTRADSGTNDPLSLERADNTAAYLTDDVDAWLEMYETSTPAARRWGNREDQLMIESLPDFPTKPAQEDSVRFFQRTRDLEVDGIAGPVTRRALITEYMSFDGTSLKEPRAFDIRITTHGCGDHFPLDESGDELDPAAEDENDDLLDRRVELFFFDAEFGIQPVPPGKNSAAGSPEYPQWRRKTERVIDLEVPDARELVLEWPDFLTPHVPTDFVLRIVANKTFELPWTSGREREGMREFVVSGFDAATATVVALTGGAELRLWDDQPVGDTDQPPTWEHVLEELLDREELEESGTDGAFPTVDRPHASPDLD